MPTPPIPTKVWQSAEIGRLRSQRDQLVEALADLVSVMPHDLAPDLVRIAKQRIAEVDEESGPNEQ